MNLGGFHVLNILLSLCFTCIRSADGVGSSSLGLDAQFTAGRSEIHERHGGSGQKLPASLKKHNCITNRWRTLTNTQHILTVYTLASLIKPCEYTHNRLLAVD